MKNINESLKWKIESRIDIEQIYEDVEVGTDQEIGEGKNYGHLIEANLGSAILIGIESLLFE